MLMLIEYTEASKQACDTPNICNNGICIQQEHPSEFLCSCNQDYSGIYCNIS